MAPRGSQNRYQGCLNVPSVWNWLNGWKSLWLPDAIEVFVSPQEEAPAGHRGGRAIVFPNFVHGQHLQLRAGLHDVGLTGTGEIKATFRRHDRTRPGRDAGQSLRIDKFSGGEIEAFQDVRIVRPINARPATGLRVADDDRGGKTFGNLR